MHSELVQTVARAPRGEIVHVQTRPGMGTIYALQTGLPDHGMDMIEIEGYRAAEMGDAAFVEFLNDVRLNDQVLVVTQSPWMTRREAAMLHMNVSQCFVKQGGRAVLVTYQ